MKQIKNSNPARLLPPGQGAETWRLFGIYRWGHDLVTIWQLPSGIQVVCREPHSEWLVRHISHQFGGPQCPVAVGRALVASHMRARECVGGHAVRGFYIRQALAARQFRSDLLLLAGLAVMALVLWWLLR